MAAETAPRAVPVAARASSHASARAVAWSSPKSRSTTRTNVAFLARYIGPTGKILGRRRTGFSGQNQRKLAAAIKNARLMGLLPYIGRS